MSKLNRYILLIFLSAVTGLSTAQERERWYNKLGNWVQGEQWVYESPQPMTHNKLVIHYGGRGVLDEYLSPISHNGYHLQISLLTDYGAPIEQKWHLYQEALVYGGEMENQANGGEMYNIGGSYSIGPSWRVLRCKGLSLDLAPLMTFYIEGNFKPSNTNNVANGKGSLGIDAWARLRYQIPWKIMPMAFSYSIQTPLLHGTFHPQYGQSYYDYISGENDRAIDLHFASLHNSMGIHQRLLVDLPIRNVTVSVGAEHSYLTQQLSHTRFREGTWSVLLGISFDIFSLSGNKSVQSEQIYSTLYR